MTYAQRLKERFSRKRGTLQANLTRRAICLGIGISLLVAGVPDKAAAFFFAGGQSNAAPPPGGIITQIGQLNTTTINGPAAALTNEICRFGHPFPDDDVTGVPVGRIPRIYPQGSGTPVATQAVVPLQYWPSGRLKHAMFAHLVSSLPGNASQTSTGLDQGNNTTLVFDVATVAGSEDQTGIAVSVFNTYLSNSSNNMTGSFTDLGGTVWSASAFTAFSGATNVANYVLVPTYWGKFCGSPYVDCFKATMPFANGGTNHRSAIAVFWAFVYHNGSTITEVEWHCQIENGTLGTAHPTIGVGNGDIIYRSADWSIGGVARWFRTMETPNATLEVGLGSLAPTISGLTPSARWTSCSPVAWISSGAFTFDQTHLSRPICVGTTGQVMYTVGRATQSQINVTAGGTGFTTPPTINSGGSAVFRAIIDLASGAVVKIICTKFGTVGTPTFSGGGGTGLTMSVAANQSAVQFNAPQDAGAICTGQTGTGGSLSLNGKNCANDGSGTKGYPRASGVPRVFMWSPNNNTGCSITINGTRTNGSTTPGTYTGPAAGAFTDCEDWDVITSITRTGTSDTLCVGIGGVPSGSFGWAGYENQTNNPPSSPARGVTYGTYTSGNWNIMGGVIPRGAAPVEIIWQNQTPRHYTSYKNQYLLDSKVLLNYDLPQFAGSAGLTSAISSTTTTINTYGKSSNATLYPDSADYNKPAYLGEGSSGLNEWNYALQESKSGGNSGLGMDSVFDLYWLGGGGYAAWRGVMTACNRIFNIRTYIRDDNTGFAAAMSAYPKLGSGSWNTNPATTGAPCFWFDPGQASGPGFGATFAWVQLDTAHCNTSSRLSYVLTCNPEILDAMQLEATTRWMMISNGGDGYNRSAAGSTGGTNAPYQQRVTAWSGLKSMGMPVMHRPDDSVTSIFAALSVHKTMLDNYFHNGSVSNAGLTDLYVTGPDYNGVMPASKGNAHMWANALTGGAGSATGYQTGFNLLAMGNLYENQVLSSYGLQFMTWVADLPMQYFNASSDICSPYIATVQWVLGSDVFRFASGKQLTSLADLNDTLIYCFPGTSIAGSPTALNPEPPATLTPTATTGSSVTFNLNANTLYTHAIGAYISGQVFNVSSNQTATPWNMTITGHPYNDGDQIYFGAGSGGGRPSQPLSYGRTIYYVKKVDANNIQVFTDAGLTNQVQFTTSGSMVVAAGLAQITSVGAGVATQAYNSIVCNIISPFLNTTPITSGNWTMSMPPAGPNNSGHAFAFPQGFTSNDQQLELKASLAIASLVPGNYAAAKTAWDAYAAQCANDNCVTSNFTFFANHVVKYRS
jgi:hypothetical protein